MRDLLLDSLDFRHAVSRPGQLVGNIGVGAQQRRHLFVERHPARLPLLQIGGDFHIAAKVMYVSQRILRRQYWLAQQRQRLQGNVKPLPAPGQPVLQQYLRRRPAGAVVELRGIDRKGILDFLEEILVIDDVAEILILPIQAVGAADRLKQAVILHRLVDIKISAGRGVEAGEQLVDHDQQLHIGRLAGEQGLGLLLVGLGLVHVGPGLDVIQQILVGVVDELLVGLGVGAGFLPAHILRLGIVGSDHRAFALEGGLLEQLVILAGLIDAGSDQNGVATAIV